MVHAENKYEAQLHDEENTWGKPTQEQEKIVAMTAQMNTLKKEHPLLWMPLQICRILGLTTLNSLLQYVNWLVWEVCSVNSMVQNKKA